MRHRSSRIVTGLVSGLVSGLVWGIIPLTASVNAIADTPGSDLTIKAGRVALVDDHAAGAQPTWDPMSVDGGATAPSETAVDAQAPAQARFGDAGALRLNILGGFAHDFDDADHYGGGIAVSYFIVDRLSVDLELMGWGFSQPGPDASGGNVNLIFRWHVYQEDGFSLFGDGGAGLLFTSDDVPSDGTSFNFTPQLGFGATWEIGDDIHLLAGLRWFHISNAQTSSDNPARDSLYAYVGLSLPLR